MAKYKYNLSYIEDSKIIPIKLGKDFTECSLKNMDSYTGIFRNEEELLMLLKYMHLIPADIDKLYISYNKEVDGKTYQNIIYDGDILLFEDENKFSKEYINYIFNLLSRRENLSLLRKLFELYYKKYNVNEYNLSIEELKQKKYKHFKNMHKRVLKLYQVIYRKENNIFETEKYLDEIEFDGYIDEFINKEFYRTTKEGKTLIYSSVRDFIIKLKYVHGLYDIDREHKYLDYNEFNNKRLTLNPKG